MKNKIPPRDWEALSAYLDGQLRPKERARIERRMKENDALRSALEELQRTRMLLRSQTSLQAPRNFTLTPEMAGMRSGESQIPAAYSAMRLASILATILFVVVFVGDLLISSRQPAPLLAAMAPKQEALEVEAVSEVVVGAADEKGTEEEFELLMEGEQPSVGVAEKRMVEATQASINKAVEIKPESAESTDQIGSEAPSAFPLAPGSILTSTVTTTLTVTPTPAATVDLYLDSGYPAPEKEVVEEMLSEDYPHPTAPVHEPSETAIEKPVLGWVKSLLAILAVITGLAAIFLRRKKSM